MYAGLGALNHDNRAWIYVMYTWSTLQELYTLLLFFYISGVYSDHNICFKNDLYLPFLPLTTKAYNNYCCLCKLDNY